MGWAGRTHRFRGASWSGGCPDVRRGQPAGRRRRRLAGLVAQAPGLRARPGSATGQPGGLCRAARPLLVQLPRRRELARGAGRGGGPARALGTHPHRPRRDVRHRALRRGGRGARPAHRVRRRTVPRRRDAGDQGRADDRRPGGRPRPAGHAPARAGPRPDRLRQPVPRHQQGPAARRREGASRLRPRRDHRGRRRALAGAHRLPQGRGAPGAGGAAARSPSTRPGGRWPSWSSDSAATTSPSS